MSFLLWGPTDQKAGLYRNVVRHTHTHTLSLQQLLLSTHDSMWWPSRRRCAVHSLYAGIQEVAETPSTAPPLCWTTVFLKCRLDTDRGDLSNTSARVHSGRWNSQQTPHRIPDPFRGLTHGGPAGEELHPNRSMHPAPDTGSCFRSEVGVWQEDAGITSDKSASVRAEWELASGLSTPTAYCGWL